MRVRERELGNQNRGASLVFAHFMMCANILVYTRLHAPDRRALRMKGGGG